MPAVKTLTVVSCHVCEQPIPKDLANLHHVIPQAVGKKGKEGPTVYLCPTCHDTTHRVAEMIRAGKQGLIEERVSVLYKHPPTRKRLYVLANTVAREMEERGDNFDPEQDAQVVLQLTRQHLDRLKLLAGDVRVNGKKLGVANYIQQILLKHLQSKGLAG